MTDTLAPSNAAIEQVLIKGDLTGLTDAQRLSHYKNVCDSLGLNPLTVPFDYLRLNGKTVLYAKRDAAEQLRKIHGVSITDITTQHVEDIYIVTAKASDKSGRTDASTGAVSVGSLKGEALANAIMKAETKAKRRVTLSICGLGMLDETEIASISGAKTEGYTVTAPARAELTPAIATIDEEDYHEVQDAPAEADLGVDLPEGATRLVSVTKAPTRNTTVFKYSLLATTGEVVTTINERYAALAEQCCQNRTPVYLQSKPTKWGNELTAIRTAGEAPLFQEPSDKMPITSDEVF